ncbi:MAG: FKBP-type peptidyl-prolyl cis-trans isomerase [bacterium]
MKNQGKMSVALAAVICLVLVGFLIFISYNTKGNMSAANNSNNTNNVVSGGDVAKGADVAKTGLSAQTGDSVSMNYTGRLQDGTVFDSNVDPKFNHVEPFVFKLGAGQVITGWDKGIVGMKVGEKKTLTLAPADAYGAGGIPGVIPPNSTLIFDVELLGINK